MKKIVSQSIILFSFGLMILFLQSCSAGATGPAGPSGGTGFVAQFQNNMYPTSGYGTALGCGIDSIGHTTNFSTGATFWIGSFSPGTARYILLFNIISPVPGNAVITKAYLTINVTGFHGSNTYAVYQLSRGCNPPTATWDTYNGTNNWTTPGGDFLAAQESDTVTIGGNGRYDFSLDAAMVQGWLTSPSTNYGMIIKALNESTATENDARIVTIADGTASAPMLTVYYNLP